MEAAWEDDTERGGRIGRLGRVLSCGNIGSAFVLVGDLGVVVSNVSEADGILCEFPETGDKVEVKKC